MTGLEQEQLAQWAVRLVVLAPFVAAVAGLLLARHRSAARVAAMTGALVALVAAGFVLWVVHTDQLSPWVTTVDPLPVGALDVPLHLVMDDLSAVVAVAVALVGTLIQAYTRAYLHADPRYGTFAATVSLFLAGMLLVVSSRDLVLTLVGWEVMGWCSYLLIGHHSRRASANRAALKAFLVTRTADLAFVLAIVGLAGAAGTTDIAAVVDHFTGSGTGTVPAGEATLLTLAMLGLLCGVAGKSGLVPFHDWLPDAMEGPTPASALIHAATMVAAGTYVLARLFPAFAHAPTARLVLAVLAVTTMVYAALLAFAQSDLKRLLAYSTLSQIAVMLSAVAVSPVEDGPGAGVFHLLSHALWKALLFLTIGWAAVLVGGTSALVLRGAVRWHPAVRLPLAIGLLSLAGVPPMVGFVSKEYVLAAAQQGAAGAQQTAGILVVGGLVLTIFLTAAYCTRAWIVLHHLTIEEEAVMLAAADPDLRDEPLPEEPVEVTLDDLLSPPTQVIPTTYETQPTQVLPSAQAPHPGAVWSREYTEPVPVGPGQPEPEPGPEPEPEPEPELSPDDPSDVHGSLDAEARFPVGVLAFLTVVGGGIVFTPMIPGIEPHLDIPAVVVSVALVVLAVVVVWVMAARRTSGDAADALGSHARNAADRGLGVDRLYVALTRPVHGLALAVVWADRVVIDAYVRGAGVATKWAGIAGEAAHTRRPSTYLVWLLLGFLAIAVAGVTLW